MWPGLSVVPCGSGSAPTVGGADRSGPPGGGATAYFVGSGVIVLVIGLTGAVRAVAGGASAGARRGS